MKWKEEFNNTFEDLEKKVNAFGEVKVRKAIKFFISTEIIEKLINDAQILSCFTKRYRKIKLHRDRKRDSDSENSCIGMADSTKTHAKKQHHAIKMTANSCTKIQYRENGRPGNTLTLKTVVQRTRN